jgi:hypothetical protein
MIDNTADLFGGYKWSIYPHPYNSDVDYLVTNDDGEALDAAQAACESAWNEIEPGMAYTVTIRLNPDWKEPEEIALSGSPALCLARKVGSDEPLTRCAAYPRCPCGGPEGWPIKETTP